MPPTLTTPPFDTKSAITDWVDKPDPLPTPDPTPAAAAAATPEPAAPAPPVEPAATPDTSAAAEAAPPVTAVPDLPPSGASAQAITDWIIAKRGEEEFKIPADAVLTLKRHGTDHQVPAAEALRDAMMGNDFKLSKAELATQRQAFQREQEAKALEAARLEERAKWLAEQERQVAEALTDPAKWEQYQQHLQQLQSNPLYRQAFESSQKQRLTDAENRVYRDRADAEYQERAVSTALGWMDVLKAKYPGVSTEAVRQRYGAQVALHETQTGRPAVLGEGPLTPAALEAVFQSEAAFLQGAVAPVSQQVAALQAEITALKAAQAAATANAQTDHAIRRAAAPNTRPGGSPAAPSAKTPPARLSEEERVSKIREWIER